MNMHGIGDVDVVDRRMMCVCVCVWLERECVCVSCVCVGVWLERECVCVSCVCVCVWVGVCKQIFTQTNT